jgi:protein gp37
MSKSSIEWTEATWNPVVGCSILSPGCTNCYAMKMAARIEAMQLAEHERGKRPIVGQYFGTTKKINGNAVWTGEINLAPQATLLQPLKRKKPTTYFVNSMGDLFHEDCPDEWIDKVFAVMAMAPQHTFQVLTKRAKRMRDYCGKFGNLITVSDGAISPMKIVPGAISKLWPLPNVWLGVSTERQQEADERIPELLKTPAAIRFISAEPLLGPIDLTNIAPDAVSVCDAIRNPSRHLDWVIVGGESGPGSRPMHPDWARSLRDQCAAAGVPFFFKQWGEWAPYDRSKADGATLATPNSLDAPMQRFGKKLAGRSLDGIEYSEMPEGTR